MFPLPPSPLVHSPLRPRFANAASVLNFLPAFFRPLLYPRAGETGDIGEEDEGPRTKFSSEKVRSRITRRRGIKQYPGSLRREKLSGDSPRRHFATSGRPEIIVTEFPRLFGPVRLYRCNFPRRRKRRAEVIVKIIGTEDRRLRSICVLLEEKRAREEVSSCNPRFLSPRIVGVPFVGVDNALSR